MTLTIISEQEIGTYGLQAGDSLIVTEGVILADNTTYAVQTTASDVSVSVLGTVMTTSPTLAAIGIGVLNFQPDRGSVFVGTSGSVIGVGSAIFFGTGADNGIVNHGQIHARHDVIHVTGGSVDILNTGQIARTGHNGTGSAISLGAETGGALSDNVRNVVNAGTISAPGLVTAVGGPAAVLNSGGTLFDLTNSGSILVGNATAVQSDAEVNRIANTGLIVGDVILWSKGIVSNTGLIDGDLLYDLGPGVTDDVYFARGHGLVTGEIQLGNGDDRATLGDLGGRVLGQGGSDTLVGGAGSDTLWGGDGDDTLAGRGGGDELWGGKGNDRLLGGDGDDLLYGEDGDDFLAGEGGADVIYGGAGRDLLVGGDGDDFLDGGADDDRLIGNAGDDTLNGGFGNDTLTGGSGEDVLTGGPGRDVLRGGTGADEFIYVFASDSETGAGSDRIVDFGAGDVIDLTATSAREMTFVGTGALLGGAAPSVRYVTNAFGHTAIFADVDGDGIPDMRIVLLNAGNLDGGDFIL